MRAAGFFLVLCLGLSAVIVWQLTMGKNERTTHRPALVPAIAAKRAPLPRFIHPDKRAYARVIDENLFSPDRRPTVEAAGSRSAGLTRADSGRPGFHLKGIIITPLGRSALIELSTGKEYRKVVKGETIDGWVIHAISSDSISVKKAGTSKMLELKAPQSRPRLPKPHHPTGRARPQRGR